MKFHEAIPLILEDFNKDILLNAKVVNIFSDYNAYEECKAIKVIIKNLITEGYMDQIMCIKDWTKSIPKIIDRFIANTGCKDELAEYVISSIGYGLKLNPNEPVLDLSPSVPAAPSKTGTRQKRNTSASPRGRISGASLNKTASALRALSEESQGKYKEDAENYLNSIIEFKSDIAKELGVRITTSVIFDLSDNSFYVSFEIDGKIKVRYDYSINFNVLIYDIHNKLINQNLAYAGVKKPKFEVCKSSYFFQRSFHKVCNIGRIVVYWEQN